jgi:hypothetical protein
MDMICLMHQGTPYGHLKVNHKSILPQSLARACGCAEDDVRVWLDELEGVGVFSRDSEGGIFSRRMVEDERVRNARAAGGKLGGNPALMKKKDGQKEVKQEVNHAPNLQPTPSSSSSSSSVKETPIAPKGAGCRADGFDEFWAAWPSSPRKQDRKKCLAKWERAGFAKVAAEILANVEASKASKQWRDGFEPAPMTYLNGERWADGVDFLGGEIHAESGEAVL